MSKVASATKLKGGVAKTTKKVTKMSLSDRIAQNRQWPILEEIVVQTVTAGGMAAMGFYRDAWKRQQTASQNEAKRNPSTLADLQATVTILHTCHSLLSPLAGALGCGLSYLGEETDQEFDDFLHKNLSDDVLKRKHSSDQFFHSYDNVIRVIFDGIDGTGNFTRGMPLFCSAVAILVDGQVRASGIYDPIHHQVYSALLPGPVDNTGDGASAFAWEVATGNRFDMVSEAQKQDTKPLAREAVGIHLTRSNPQKLLRFLRTLQRLALESGGIYALNSGIVAMKEVARGALGGFVNNFTNPWDVAAGEVLVRACGGTVTDFSGRAITYTTPGKISVIAVKKHLHGEIQQILNSCVTSQDDRRTRSLE